MNNNYGIPYKGNIYYIDYKKNLFGTYGYLVNNKNIIKIYNNLLIVNDIIDIKYRKLNNLVLYPIIVNQNYKLV